MGVEHDAFRHEFPGANPYANQAARNVVRLGDVIVDRVNFRQRNHGLHVATAQALAILEGADHPLTPHEIGAHLHLTSGSVTSVLDSLEKRGLIRRSPHPEDRRKVSVGITDEGRALVNAFLPETVVIMTALFSALTDDEIATLNDLISRVLTHSTTVNVDEIADRAPSRVLPRGRR